jgi:hypothetical protein
MEIRIDGQRDKVERIEEMSNYVTLIYIKNEQVRPIKIEKEIIDFVYITINKMIVGERYTSKYIYMNYINHFKIKSQIYRRFIESFIKYVDMRNIDFIVIDGIIRDLDNDEVSLMSFEEFIGTRKTQDSLYFKLWGAIRYWVEKGIIQYNSKGSVWRVL